MKYSHQDSAVLILFFSRQSSDPGRSISCRPAAHSTQQYQSRHTRQILVHCLLESSLAYSPVLVLAWSISFSNFYLPKFLCAPKHPCWSAPSEFLMRNRSVITIANRTSSELCTQACIYNCLSSQWCWEIELQSEVSQIARNPSSWVKSPFWRCCWSRPWLRSTPNRSWSRSKRATGRLMQCFGIIINICFVMLQIDLFTMTRGTLAK